jgi:hypothetical protein
MEMADNMRGLKRTLWVRIPELWSHHNEEWRLGQNIQEDTS